jgi:hypothetical protein
MGALVTTSYWRSAVTRVTVSWRAILPTILLLCLAGCAGGPVFTAIPQPLATDAPPVGTPEPAPLLTGFTEELLQSSWQLEGMIVDGQMRPPWNEEQCLAVGYRPEEYYFYTGCNHGYCDLNRGEPASAGEEAVRCTVTVEGCFTTPDPATGARRQVEWEQPFADAMMERRAAEVRDAQLWLTAEDKSRPVLVFRRVHACKGEDNYLRP